MGGIVNRRWKMNTFGTALRYMSPPHSTILFHALRPFPELHQIVGSILKNYDRPERRRGKRALLKSRTWGDWGSEDETSWVYTPFAHIHIFFFLTSTCSFRISSTGPDKRGALPSNTQISNHGLAFLRSSTNCTVRHWLSSLSNPIKTSNSRLTSRPEISIVNLNTTAPMCQTRGCREMLEEHRWA